MLKRKLVYLPRLDCLLIWHWGLWFEGDEKTKNHLKPKIQSEVDNDRFVVIGDFDHHSAKGE